MTISKHLPDHAEQIVDVALAMRQLYPVREAHTDFTDADGVFGCPVYDQRDEPARRLMAVGLLDGAVFLLSPA